MRVGARLVLLLSVTYLAVALAGLGIGVVELLLLATWLVVGTSLVITGERRRRRAPGYLEAR